MLKFVINNRNIYFKKFNFWFFFHPRLSLFIIVQIIRFTSISAAIYVPCESVHDVVWNLDGASRKTCLMITTTSIHSEEAFVSSPVDATVKVIHFNSNKQIVFLPSRVDLKFPSLELYAAGRCEIEKISKRNFKNLKHLTHLWLGFNQIEYVPSDTFEDLIAIQDIQLSKWNLHQF